MLVGAPEARPLFAGLTVAIFLGALPAFGVEVYTGQPIEAGKEYLLAGWNFNDAGAPPGSQQLVNHGTGVLATDWDPSAWTDYSGTAENSFGSDGAGRDVALRNGAGLSNEGRFLEFHLSLSHFENFSVTYATRRSATGFTDQQWQWSVDGETFVSHETIVAAGSWNVVTIDFSEVTALENAADAYLRLVLQNPPAGASATGNNRFDNFQFRAVASVGTAGPGEATLSNSTAGSPYRGTKIFAPGELQSADIHLVELGGSSMETISVALPDGWSGLEIGGVELFGSGLADASVAVEDEVVTVFHARVTEGAPGTIQLNDLSTPAEADIADLGRTAFTVKTAAPGELLAEIGRRPVGYLTIPVERIRPVDGAGVPLALGRKVAVTGVATVSSGVFSATDFLGYLQDATAGVAIFHSPSGAIWTPFMEGHRYTAVGSLTHSRGLTRIELAGNDGLISLGAAETPEPRAFTIAQLMAAAEDLEGMLVRIKRVEKASASPAWPEPGLNGTLLVTDDGGQTTLEVYLNRFTDVSLAPEPDYPIDLVGVFSQYSNPSGPFDTGYQLIPRGADDFLEASDPETGFAAWQQDFFDAIQQAQSAISGPGDDPDRDGVVNLLEYALGANPWTDSRGLLPRVVTNDGALSFQFRRVRDANDVVYEVEASSDLTTWVRVWTSAEQPYTAGEAVMEESVTETAGNGSQERRFLRLVVTRSAP